MAHVSNIREMRGLIEISLDGVTWLRVRKKHFAMRPLNIGEDIDPEAYLVSLAAVQAADCYEAALCILDRAAQTGGNLREKLVFKGYVRPAAEAAVERLTENHLIDDMRFAQRIAQSSALKPVGAYAVQRKLRAKRLPQEASALTVRSKPRPAGLPQSRSAGNTLLCPRVKRAQSSRRRWPGADLVGRASPAQ